MKVVLDTNVYVSSLLSVGGVCDRVLTLGRERKIALFLSPWILREVEGVLLSKFRWSAERVGEVLEELGEFATSVHPEEGIRFVEKDPDDDRILECAAAAKADAIVSGDRHLTGLGQFRGIPILRPRAFLELYQRSLGRRR